MPNWRKQAFRFFVVVAVSFLAAQLVIWFGSNDIDEFTEQKSNDGHVLNEQVQDIHDNAAMPNRSDLFRQLDLFQNPDGKGMDYSWEVCIDSVFFC